MQPVRPPEVHIVSLGDSFSCGEGVGLRIDLPQTWVGLLAAALPECRWTPLAVAGATVGDVRHEQLPVALALQPDLVTLLVGLNDVVRAGFEAVEVAEHLLAVVETLLDTGAAVLLVRLHDPGAMLPIPRQLTGPLRRGLAVRVGVLQAAVDSLAGRPGVHVLDLADVPGLGDAAGWATDRIHPSATGHRHIAAEASAVLRRAGSPVAPLASDAQRSSGPSAAAQLRWLVAHGLPWTASHVRSVALPLLAVSAGLGRRSSRPAGRGLGGGPGQGSEAGSSGSMRAAVGGTDRITLAQDTMKSAMAVLPDTFAVGLWAFAVDLEGSQDWVTLAPTAALGAAGTGSHHDRVAGLIDTLPSRLSGGGTGLYDTALAAVHSARAAFDPAAANSVMLLTDGKNEDSAGITLDQLLKTLAAESDPLRPVKVFPIALGPEPDLNALDQIARATQGRAFSADSRADLQQVVLEAIRHR